MTPAAVDYLAEVYVTGTLVGRHEGAEDPFELDASDMIRPGANNVLAVRVEDLYVRPDWKTGQLRREATRREHGHDSVGTAGIHSHSGCLGRQRRWMI